jgi:hypothetical protein
MKRTHTRKKGIKENDSMALTYENIMDIGYFKRILPFLTFEEDETIPDIPHSTPDKHWKEVLNKQGVVRLGPTEIWGSHGVPADTFKKLVHGMDRLRQLNLPVWLLAVSKELQGLLRAIARFVQNGMGSSYKYIADYGIFRVGLDTNGWAPHRDRDIWKNALDSHGNPMYITAWMPITNATTFNSCLYFIPRIHDPTYEKDGRKSYMDVIFDGLNGYQNILALPVKAGGLLSFSSRTIHWGSSPLPPVVGGKRTHYNRYAISVAVAREEFEKQPLVRKGATEYPTFIEAVVLAASVCLRYTHNIPIRADHKKCLKKVVKKHMDFFETEYRSNHSD